MSQMARMRAEFDMIEQPNEAKMSQSDGITTPGLPRSAFVKGDSRASEAGKKRRGKRNRYSKANIARMHAKGFVDPLDLLLAIANDPRVPNEIRAKAAKDASPYVHRRKPQAMEISGKFEFLSQEEREMRRGLLLEEIRARQARLSAPAGEQLSEN